MNILILHRIPYHQIEYHRGIDHARHEVTYFGTAAALATLPAGLRRQEAVRAGRAGVFEEAKAWLGKAPRHFDRVIALSGHEMLEAAQLRDWLGIPGASEEQVTRVRHKIRMKQDAARAGLRVPRFQPLTEFLRNRDLPLWRGRTVLKPHGAPAGGEVAVFDTTVAARAAVLGFCSGIARLDAVQHTDACGDFEVEEFVEGPVLHFDGLVADGQILALSASRHVNSRLGYACGKPLGSLHIPATGAIRRWATQALESVGLREGGFHLEAIESGDELVFLDIAPRAESPDVVAAFELATGIHLPSHELRILLGEHPGHALNTGACGERWHGWFAVPGHHLGGGAHGGLGGIAAFRRSDAVLRWNELRAGAMLPEAITYQAHEVPLAGIIATATPAQTQAWMESLFAALRWEFHTTAHGRAWQGAEMLQTVT
ncbi:ATP-grasp domain-containing protein [Paracidovorax anthurii]|uniref:ATP-grasp domain-containing protein n=1 Tax=Paracidovorax anthurii TaxID=78229 RepID=A0A328YYK6_9BURK|nr:carboxylate--amine ligase [Paracidovorax anthurii]RAR78870.1 hypothetical protein AX018_102813 [Paracidovorax anthurii]WCM91199.1 carboxylate--amine ligase [Acidovorax sp. NCPPB 2350]